MAQLDLVLRNLVEPIVDNPEQLEVREMPSSDENEVVLYIYATNDDIARLIGRKGTMATALRQIMSVASHTDDKRVTIKFEQI